MELARCLTGWTVKDAFWRGQFTFDADRHDPGVKTVLGLTIPPDGQHEAEQVLDVLATHPSTARFIATKLVRRFIADDPPAGLVERGARAFTHTGGDLRAVLRTILLDGLSLAQLKFKRPINFIASALRQLNAQTDSGDDLHDFVARLGQLHFSWPTPDGYPDRAGAWQGNLMPRWQFALALARNEIPGTQVNLSEIVQASGAHTPAEMTDRLSMLLLGAPLPTGVRDDLLSALQPADEAELPHILTAGLLASPAFQWR
jgi:uncharacterized protein (DUF1800 family)